MDGIRIPPEGPIKTGGSSVDHEGGAISEKTDEPNRRQPQVQQKALEDVEITSRGPEIERQIVSWGKQQNASSRFQQLGERMEQLFRPGDVLETMGAEDDVKTGRRQHAIQQRVNHNLVGNLL